MSQSLSRIERLPERQQMTEEQIELVKSTIAKGATNDELALFIMQCNRTGLDPFARQIYSIKRGSERTTQVSIDGARLVAERSGRYRPGTTYYYDAEGAETTVWLTDTAPVAARVTVFKDDHEVPGVPVRWKERAQQTHAWKNMPATMLAKCAEMATLRQAFPQELSGLYSVEEIGPAGKFSYPANESRPFEDAEPEPEAIEAADSGTSTPVVSAATAGADEQPSGSAQSELMPRGPRSAEQEETLGIDILGEPLDESTAAASAVEAPPPEPSLEEADVPDEAASASPFQAPIFDPVQEAGAFKFTRGSHAGKSVAEVCEADPIYAQKALKSPNEMLVAAVTTWLAHLEEAPA